MFLSLRNRRKKQDADRCFSLPCQCSPPAWIPNPYWFAPWTPNVPWLGEEGEMQPEVQTRLRVTAFPLEEMGVKELE